MSYHGGVGQLVAVPLALAALAKQRRVAARSRAALFGLGVAPGFGPAPGFTPTTAFAQAVDPYSFRFSPPGAVFAPYGWGPDMMIGMPASYTHHIGYERVPIPGARRNVGTMYDEIPPYATGVRLSGTWSGGGPGYVTEGSSAQLGGMLAVL